MCVHACGVNIHTSAGAACRLGGRHCRCGLQRRRRPLRRACGRRRGGKLRATAVGRSILLPPAAASAAALVAGSQRSPCGADGAALHRLGVEERARLARPLLSPPPPSQRSAATLLPTPHAHRAVRAAQAMCENGGGRGANPAVVYGAHAHAPSPPPPPVCCVAGRRRPGRSPARRRTPRWWRRREPACGPRCWAAACAASE